MTLKDKFKKLLCKNFTINQLESISEKFAVEFVKWYDLNNFKYNGWEKTTSTKELLEIFKKEKGL
jgi:hypothetical protein